MITTPRLFLPSHVCIGCIGYDTPPWPKRISIWFSTVAGVGVRPIRLGRTDGRDVCFLLLYFCLLLRESVQRMFCVYTCLSVCWSICAACRSRADGWMDIYAPPPATRGGGGREMKMEMRCIIPTYLPTYLHACPCVWCVFYTSATLSASLYLAPYAWPELHPPAACNSHEIRHDLYYIARYLNACQGLSRFPDGAISDVMRCTR